jgi:predicted DNA-binding transcriptional regulator YafY
VVAAARLKVMAALPPERRARAGRVAERFHLDAPGWFQPAEELAHLETLAGAVWDSHRLRIRYRRGERGGVVDREIDPLGLVLKGGIWYVVARAVTNVRTYRVSRVEAVEVLDERFERPDDFELADYWQRSTAAYERELDRVHLTVRVAVDRLDAFADVAGSRVMSGAMRLDDEPDHVRLRVAFDWADEAISAALRMGASAEVLEPEWLRESIVKRARAVVERYTQGSVAAVPA